MSVLTTIQTARKRHWCCHCQKAIEPGQRYERHAMTPRDEMNDGTAWRMATNHLFTDCLVMSAGQQR